MKNIIPEKLQQGDEIRVIAPSRSLGIISQQSQENAQAFFESLGFRISFGKHVNEIDDSYSSSIELRIKDLHEAFQDKNVKAIFTVIGGFNANQLLREIDWQLIKNNPKIFCGFSDITALSCAIYAKTGLVTYSGPHFSTFGQKHLDPYTSLSMQSCLMRNDPFEVKSSENWTDDFWWKEQDARQPIKNEGWWVLQEETAEGTLIGGNLCTMNLQQGTEFVPDIQASVLYLEDDEESRPHAFDRDLQSLIHQPQFKNIKGLVIGRFQKASLMTRKLLEQIIRTKKELAGVPIIANVDFGHTEPKITFPVGGTVEIKAAPQTTTIRILEH
jgi:muramoyltetrapeptide carboxypeptidase LdcA involved in peptidoglycan recycling